MDVGFERGVAEAEVLDHVQRDAARVAVGFVVEVDGGGLGVAFVGEGGREVGLDGEDVGEGFHAEFGDEAAAEEVEGLVGELLLVPDVPLVEVAAGGVRGGVVAGAFAAEGGAGVVVGSWGGGGADVGEELFVNVARGEGGFEPGLGVEVGGVIVEWDGFLVLVVFVVAGENGE